MRKEIMIDNFTLQGAYGFLFEGRDGVIYKGCLSNLLEATVLYDRVTVPPGIIAKNRAVREIVNLFDGVIVEAAVPQSEYNPDFPWHSYDGPDIKTNWVLSHIGTNNPFIDFTEEQTDLIHIDTIGWHRKTNINFDDFKKRHAWYTYYCVMFAGRFGFNYLPNPTRYCILNNRKFDKAIISTSTRRKLIRDIEKLWSERGKLVNDMFEDSLIDIDAPIIYSYIFKESNGNNNRIIESALQMRESYAAKGYRKWCAKIEEAIEKDDRNFLVSQIKDVEKHVQGWSEKLGNNSTQKIRLNIYWISTDVDIARPNFLWKKHLVFLHQLLR